MSVSLERARHFHSLGFTVIPLKPQSKEPYGEWKRFQTSRPSDDDLVKWFGNGVRRNAGLLGASVVIESDTPEAENWCQRNLPPTPMMTRSARGIHRHYRKPTGDDAAFEIPAEFYAEGIRIEVKRDGQYVVAPDSVHPTGHVYHEVEPWPSSLDDLPEFPVAKVWYLTGAKQSRGGASVPAEPLPGQLEIGNRNTLLFREGCRLRRLGWAASEIRHALLGLNDARCHPRLDPREVEAIAASCARYEATSDTLPLTEAGDAEFFASCFANEVRYDHRRGCWLHFTGHHWEPERDGNIGRLALEAIRARQAAALKIENVEQRAKQMKWAMAGEARKRQTNLLAIAQTIKPIADAGDSWDLDPWLLGVTNGVVDLRTGGLRDGRPEDRITLRARAAFDATTICPLWDKTIAEIFAHDQELIAYFDRYVGYSLTGDCREETLAFCWGDGANGKGTLMNTLGWLLGDYADDMPFSAFEAQARSSIPNDIAKLVGKRFVTSSETSGSRRLNEARIKALTGRDPITARFLHQEFFTFQPVAKFWFATNEKPEVRDTSAGFWRRIHLIPFQQSFATNPDRQLKDKLRSEAAGILARAVRGCLAWQRDGLKPPVVVREATEGYREESKPLTRFYQECCFVRDDKRATFGQLFEAYKRWTAREREPRLGKHAFSEALREKFKTDPNDTQRVTFVGIGVLEEQREAEF